MKDICSHNSCTGCKVCLNVCTHNAISFSENHYGFWYPVIDESLCIDCGLCKKACPNNIPPVLHAPLKAVIGHAIDKEEQKSSTSGGVASALCRYILRAGGVVYGCTSAHYPLVHHIRVESENGLELLKGSKYVQSDVEDVFGLIRQDLQERKVVFVGTPCYCAGLKKYIHKDSENLVLIDFVCHGVPSQKILKDAVEEVSSGEQIQTVQFRKKTQCGESKYGLFLGGENGRSIYQNTYPKDDYIITFLSGMFYRPSCYECKYAQVKRCSDITLGDYWDREKKTSFQNRQYGLSMIMVNTKKGKWLLDECSSKIISVLADVDNFVARNGQLHHSMPKHEFYESFHRDYLNHGWKYVCEKYVKLEKRRVRKALLVLKIRDLIYTIPGMRSLYSIVFK
ncbi:Coenzyme F420 hydrogenase/dehydrogenase, beta subunit C-terminal domain [Parabacteroides sp.]|uniref:Coenzyme F420 hydrogenase/dehydrogenase, beta subunit C-terminal domain n=1 Tax=Parabacteroides sp. TaxID=1869337 RepID=UPI00257EE527|nr:Coenzyme F420 hydrogenase/dehydrogenase, beta subunit C-terminal domain [Parabacteroides sp.]